MGFDDSKAVKDAKRGIVQNVMEWGKSPLPPTLLATLTTALYLRPFQPLPMIFPPVLLFSTYLNLSGFKVDSAGITAAWSGLYLLLVNRRKNSAPGGFAGRVSNKFGARGLTRGAAIGVAAANVVGGFMTYTFGKRENNSP